MKFSPIQINIFTNLMKEPKYKGTESKVGRPKVNSYVGLFKSILFKIKTGVKWEDTKLYGKFSSSSVYKYYKLWSQQGLFNALYVHSLKLYSKHRRIKERDICLVIVSSYRFLYSESISW